jgi:hypothetical protein
MKNNATEIVATGEKTMKEISASHESRTYGQRIRFQIEFMHTMLASGREIEALTAINKALDLADEVHELEEKIDGKK